MIDSSKMGDASQGRVTGPGGFFQWPEPADQTGTLCCIFPARPLVKIEQHAILG